jgi:hypothetical protein
MPTLPNSPGKNVAARQKLQNFAQFSQSEQIFGKRTFVDQ